MVRYPGACGMHQFPPGQGNVMTQVSTAAAGTGARLECMLVQATSSVVAVIVRGEKNKVEYFAHVPSQEVNFVDVRAGN